MTIERTPAFGQQRRDPSQAQSSAGTRTRNAEFEFQREVTNRWLSDAGMLHAEAPQANASKR